MKKLASFSAVVVLGAAATPFAEVSAATVEITGNSYWIQYGTQSTNNNVVNYAPSGITDSSPWNPKWKKGGEVNATLENYSVDWYFNGAEAGYTNTFTSGLLTFAEGNQNNNWDPGNDALGWQFLGTTTGSGAGDPIDFRVEDQNGNGITNGDNKWPGKYSPSLIFSYASPLYDEGEIAGWELSLSATDWFVFAFNDKGSKDKDHDDYIGLAHVFAPSEVPLPGALPLMGTVVGGGFLMRRWRNRKQRATA